MSLFERPEEFSVPVKRVRLASAVGGPVLVDGELFSGIGYVPTDEDEFLLRPVRVVDGVPALGEDADDPALAAVNGVTVLDAGRHPGYEKRLRPGHDRLRDPWWLEKEHALDSEPITGSFVEFSADGVLLKVDLTKNGQHVDAKRFDPSGVLVEHRVAIVPEDRTGDLRRITQSANWFASGKPRGLTTFFYHLGEDGGSAQVSMGKEGLLSAVKVTGSYFECAERCEDLLVYPAFADFRFLDELGPAGQQFGFASDERSEELADRLISNQMLDDVSLLYPSGADHAGLARLSEAELPNLHAVLVEPGYGKDYGRLIEILGLWRRRTGVGASVEYHRIRMASELLTDLEITPANEGSEVGTSYLFVDDTTAAVVGLMGFLGDGLTEHVLQSRTLRFVRSTHAKTSGQLRSASLVAADAVVYGSELEHEDWLALVRQQLIDEGRFGGPSGR